MKITGSSRTKAKLGENKDGGGRNWQKKSGNNSDGSGRRIKEIQTAAKLSGFKPRMTPSFNGNSFHSHHSQHLWLPGEGGRQAGRQEGLFVCERERERKKKKTEHKSV